jgi:hypothetical protein
MMHALISGQAGLAVVWDNHRAWRVSYESPDQRLDCPRDGIERVFHGAHDVQSLQNTTVDEAVQRMLAAWRCDRALQLSLILLEPEDDENRQLAAECVERHFQSSTTAQAYVANRLYSAPLPAAADIAGAMDITRVLQATQLTDLLERIANDQEIMVAGGFSGKHSA